MVRIVGFLFALSCCSTMLAETTEPSPEAENKTLRRKVVELEFKLAELEVIVKDLASRVPKERWAQRPTPATNPPTYPRTDLYAPRTVGPHTVPPPNQSALPPPGRSPQPPIQRQAIPWQAPPTQNQLPPRANPWQQLEINGHAFYIVPVAEISPVSENPRAPSLAVPH